MLYDNAQLASLYLHGWLATGSALPAHLEETLDYVRREMTHPAAASTRPRTPTRGRRGQVLVWSADGSRSPGDPRPLARGAALAYWGVDDGPNFEATASCSSAEPEEVAGTLGMTVDELMAAIGRARALSARRALSPVHPALDDKVLASWTAHAAAFAEAASVLGRGRLLAAAVRNAEFLGRQMSATAACSAPGRTARPASPATSRLLDGGAGLLALYEAHLRPALARRVAAPRGGGAAALLEPPIETRLRYGG